MKKIALIGSTGSIGKQVIEVVKRYPDEFEISALVASRNEKTFLEQVEELKPKYSALASKDKQKALDAACLPDADIVFNAAGGFEGLEYSLTALNAGKPLALANKETLVCGGDIVMPYTQRGGLILPVDSEHSAIWQCLHFNNYAPLRRLIITASGGAFRDMPAESLSTVTPQQALAHPTWKMGAKITVDSATLMNKGYEVIEAHMLYGTPYSKIDTVIQPQSIVHSLVEFTDGSTLAQMSYPTMEVPIQLALSYPQRLKEAVTPMDYTKPFSLDFKPLDKNKYPCFKLALACGEQGGIMPCVLNAADEIAVKAFLNGKIAFTDIYRVVDGVVSAFSAQGVKSFEQLRETDAAARLRAQNIIDRL
ncbi:MAG: 1-deoxy-D-xylulose-5-phosphate reductoisomerase [Clostridia bacterium]|nr:1-deoxy-D-xylulose-5-phosphate reductoisomerase [Clostridia bacterium]